MGLFSGTWDQPLARNKAHAITSRGFAPTFCSYRSPLRAWTGISGSRLAYPLPSSLVSTPPRRCRNINLLGIAYAFRPRLSIRLTLGGLTFPRKPWAYGERVFNPLCRYSYRHQHYRDLHPFLRLGFSGPAKLPYRRETRTLRDPQLRCCA